MTVCLNAAPSRAMSADLVALVDILVVNSIEAEALCDVRIDSLQSASTAARELIKRFPVVLVSVDGDGDGVAVALSEGDDFELPAKPVDVVSAHGAGDMYCGVLCVELVAGTMLNNAVRIAKERATDHVGLQ